MDAIREVGPGKHFLGCAHTQANFETRLLPLAARRQQQLTSNGRPRVAQDMARRANARWKKQLAEYVAPPLDPAIDEALLDFINRRKAAAPDSNGLTSYRATAVRLRSQPQRDGVLVG